MERKNLKLLADYLWNLPANYKHFDINIYHEEADEPLEVTFTNIITHGVGVMWTIHQKVQLNGFIIC